MDLRYFILGANIALISALLALYGLLTNNPSLMGLFASTLIMGLVIITLSFSTREGLLNTLLNYSTMLTKCATTIIEDFDLLEATPTVTRRDGNVYIVLARSNSIDVLEPGVGFYKNAPYFAIPVGDLVSGVEELVELSGLAIETSLSEVLVDEFSMCRRIRVEYSDKTIKLTLIDVDKRIREFLKYPLDPATSLTMIALNKLINKDLVLKNKSVSFDNVVYVLEVVDRVESS